MRKDSICTVFVRNSLYNVGGIETYIYKSIQSIIKKGDKAAWISDDFSQLNELFIDLVSLQNIFLIKRNKSKHRIKEICTNYNFKKINIITFCPRDFVYAETLKKHLNAFSVDTFLFVPHFKGDVLYLEEGFRNISKKGY